MKFATRSGITVLEVAEERPHDDARYIARAAWAGLIAAAGAVATVGALVYFVGAAALWIALNNRGYSADVGIEHQPRTQLIALGLRGAIAVICILGVLAVLGFLALLIPGVRRALAGWRFRWVLCGATALLVAASYFGWRWLALAIAAASLVLFGSVRSRFPMRWRRAYSLAMILPATLTALAWVVGGPVRVTSVFVIPPSKSPMLNFRSYVHECDGAGGSSTVTEYAMVGGEKVWVADKNGCNLQGAQSRARILRSLQQNCSIPYFGESSELVYLGQVAEVREPKGACEWDPRHIVELRREDIRLKYHRDKASFPPPERTPLEAARDLSIGFFQKLDGKS